MCRRGGPRCAGHMSARVDAAEAHVVEVEERIAAGSIPAYLAETRRAAAARRLARAQSNYGKTRQGIADRIARLNGDPDRDDPSRDPERQAILDDTLAYQLQMAAHRKGVRQIAAEQGQSPDQVVADIRRDGGFTHDFTRGMTPTVGYMVSLPGHERKIRMDGKSDRDLAASIRDYARERRELLRQPGAYVGGWVNPDNGILYLDVSRVETDVAAARAAAIANQQEAFYDKQCGDEVFVLRGVSEARDNYEGEGGQP